MKKILKINYDPYLSKAAFETAPDPGGPWTALPSDSALQLYAKGPVLFANCAEDIVLAAQEELNNTPEGLEIQFAGTERDFDLLKSCADALQARSVKDGPLSCWKIGVYRGADEALEIIRNGYERIAGEFADYLPGQKKYEDNRMIGDGISKFREIVSKEIPVCILGNYSVGKSAFVNAMIGGEILPSRENPSTSKNVKVIRSDAWQLSFTYRTDEEKETTVRMSILDGDMRVIDLGNEDINLAGTVRNRLMTEVRGEQKKRQEILYAALDYLNRYDPSDEFLQRVGWNLIVEVPFYSDILSRTDAQIVFYDTPGSNNVDIDPAAHREALEKLMGEQTNALPILVTTRDSVSSNDNYEMKRRLDEYYDNFSNPHCLVVFSKGDLMTRSQLQEAVPEKIRNWHGRSTILFAAPVAALGERKTDGWLNGAYEEVYEAWKAKMQDEKRAVCLPDFNVIPNTQREPIDVRNGIPDLLYASGIPSVEAEILYYIRDGANFKKCERGRRDLMDALAAVKLRLADLESLLQMKRDEAEVKKEHTRRELIAQLNRIDVERPTLIADELGVEYQEDVDSYCEALPQVLNDIFENVRHQNPLEMDRSFDDALRADCQKELIDRCYKGAGAIQERLIGAMYESAKVCTAQLHEFVENSQKNLSEEAWRSLGKYMDTEVKPPTFSEVQSVLVSLSELFEKTALIPYQLTKTMSKDETKAKDRWLEVKKNSFVKRINDGKGMFGTTNYGLFRLTAINRPFDRYFDQLKNWAREYRLFIEQQIDQGSAVLSGMEDEIREMDQKIADLKERMANVTGVEESIRTVLSMEKV